MAKITLTDKLEACRKLIFNSRDAEITALLGAYGIDSTYLDEGEALYNETMGLFEQQKKEYQEQSRAFDKFYVEKDEAEKHFRKTFKLVTVLARKDKDLQSRLKLTLGTNLALEEWIGHAITFYNSLLAEAELVTKLVRFKVTTEQLNAEKAAIENLRPLRDQATLEKGQAQEATRLRNEKLIALEDYCIELQALAELSLEKTPQLMEKLGIVVPA